MNSVKYVKNPIVFLRETGLLYEINRTILHPLGLALAVQMPKQEADETEVGVVQLWDCRDEKEGVLYGEEAFVSGMERYAKFMDEFGDEKLTERFEELGYYIQSLPDPYYLQKGIELELTTEDEPPVLFKVPPAWLEPKVRDWYDMNLEEFLQAKLGLDISPIYEAANKEGVIMN